VNDFENFCTTLMKFYVLRTASCDCEVCFNDDDDDNDDNNNNNNNNIANV
jgi:hypothetical protein